MPKLTTKAAFKSLMNLYDAKDVKINYDLVSSADVIIQSLHIGYTEMKLRKDQDPSDKNHFVSKEEYHGIYREQGLRVSVFAGGMVGGFFELKISLKGAVDPAHKNLITYPIKITTDGQGHLDIADFFNY